MSDDTNDDLVDLDRTPITVERWILEGVLDVATQSMDFGSGFLVDAEVIALRAAAELLGIDPIRATPSNFLCQFRNEHTWVERTSAWGANTDRWYCATCHHTSPTGPFPDRPAVPVPSAPPLPRGQGINTGAAEMTVLTPIALWKVEREQIAEFVRAADARVDGTGDFDAYHSARHDLVMALGGEL